MKHALLLLVGLCLFLGFCTRQETNPFFETFNTAFGVPPFDEIRENHYLPAFQEGVKQQKAEIEKIVLSQDAPTFGNTLEALEKSGVLLTRVNSVFGNLTSAHTNEKLQEIAKEVAPLLSKHADDIFMDDKLFKKIKTVFGERAQLDLNMEERTLLEKWYREFVRGGARLDDTSKAKLREINEELSVLSVRFGESILKENNTFELVIEREVDLAGLPAAVVATAAETAGERGHNGQWVFTLHKPSMIPFLQYSEKRDLRKKIFTAYTNRGNNGDDQDTREIVLRMAALRLAKAQLLGYNSYADYVLEENMAKNPGSVYELLDQLWEPSLAAARLEASRLQHMIGEEGESFALEPWDWWFYTERLRKQQYDLDEEELRPYFQIENVRDGAFAVATRLYGLAFKERTDLPTYHPDVRSYEVLEEDGSHVGVLYLDYFPRASKEGGAWMNAYRKQSAADTPIVSNVCNFSKPTAGKPALLSFEEVSTLFHEFGHALHGLLSDCTYRTLSGTDVPRDFVELPSQIMENWASEPEVLKMFAKHYQTGEVIPDQLIGKIKESSRSNKGFESIEYLAAAYLDMNWHTLTDAGQLDVHSFEQKVMERIGLIPQIVARYKSTYFSHIFDGSYPAGYYSYYWAQVLDADAFQAFLEMGIFDRKTAQSFRRNILARGATEDPMALYLRFRGEKPQVDAMLARIGLK